MIYTHDGVLLCHETHEITNFAAEYMVLEIIMLNKSDTPKEIPHVFLSYVEFKIHKENIKVYGCHIKQ